MADLKSVWQEVMQKLRQMSVFEQEVSKPKYGPPSEADMIGIGPPLSPDEAMGILGAASRLEDAKRVNEPGAMAVDFIPSRGMSDEEQEEMRYRYERAGRTYLPDPQSSVKPSSIPKGVLYLPTREK